MASKRSDSLERSQGQRHQHRYNRHHHHHHQHHDRRDSSPSPERRRSNRSRHDSDDDRPKHNRNRQRNHNNVHEATAIAAAAASGHSQSVYAERKIPIYTTLAVRNNNMFANDGSFMDLFRQKTSTPPTAAGVAAEAPGKCAAAPTTATATSVEPPCALEGTFEVTGTTLSKKMSMVHRTLPPGATYAKAATTYVHLNSSAAAGAAGDASSSSAGMLASTEATVVGSWTTSDNGQSTSSVDLAPRQPLPAAAAAAAIAPAPEPSSGITSKVIGKTTFDPPLPLDTKSSTGQAAIKEKPASLLSFVGRRRGGKLLPTGVVKKTKLVQDKGASGGAGGGDQAQGEKGGRTDAWAQYMAEVRRYKEMSCDDDSKTRPLVK